MSDSDMNRREVVKIGADLAACREPLKQLLGRRDLTIRQDGGDVENSKSVLQFVPSVSSGDE